MNTIQSGWESFSNLVIPNVSKIQHDEMKKAFYAGAWEVVTIMMGISEKEVSEDAGAMVFQSLIEECQTFKDSIG